MAFNVLNKLKTLSDRFLSYYYYSSLEASPLGLSWALDLFLDAFVDCC